MLRKFIKFTPNVFTLSSLFLGCSSVVSSFSRDFEAAFVLILLAAVVDFLDGFVARLLNATSELGAQLDSLSDVVSFGVAPGIMCFCFAQDCGLGFWAYLAFLFPMMTAYRLARFNISGVSTHFVGLPSPAAGIYLSMGCLIFLTRPELAAFLGNDRAMLLLGLSFFIGLLEVSNIKFLSLKFDAKLNTSQLLVVAVSVVFIGIGTFFYRELLIFFIFTIYILFSTLRSILKF